MDKLDVGNGTPEHEWGEHLHIHTTIPGLGGYKLETESNSRGTNVRVYVDRPIRDGETEADALKATVAMLVAARAEVQKALGPDATV